jgi:signal transduction histidine kinase/CheY-like chemotaxis protein
MGAPELETSPENDRLAHVVQFYEDDEFLCDVVADFAGVGLRDGEAVIVIAVEAHRRSILRRLAERGFEVDGAVASDQLILLDAPETLATFMVDGMPDPGLLGSVIGEVLARARAGGRRTRGYGEMVDLLWGQGNQRAALALEAAWNEARGAMSGLLCGYSMNGFGKESQAEGFARVCEAHTAVEPTEVFREAEQLGRGRHEIARLQQRARALETELGRRHELEVALRRTLEREQIAGRTKDEFMAMLGHELRNPVGAIAMSIEVMGLRLGEAAIEERRAIGRQVKLLARLLDDLLDGARLAYGKVELRREPLEVASVVGRALEMAAPLIARKQHTLRVSVSRHGLSVEGDSERLTQAIGNLLTNAAKYTPERGTIQVTGERAEGRVVLRVEDDGVGIAPGLLSRVFEPFVQGDRSLDRSEGGLGMGLAITKKLIELHGGTVSARSGGSGRGSEFTLSLPYLPDAVCRPDGAPGALAPEAAKERLDVVVVDDNVDMATAVGDLVRLMGHEVAVVHHALPALAALSGGGADVALVDIGLPEIDGYELARRLRAATGPRVFLVALTGYGGESHRVRSREAGFDAHLVKPIDLGALSALLGELKAKVGRRPPPAS